MKTLSDMFWLLFFGCISVIACSIAVRAVAEAVIVIRKAMA